MDLYVLLSNTNLFKKSVLNMGIRSYNKVLYALFWVIPWYLNFVCQRFGTHCLFHLHRHLLTYEDGTDRVFQNVGIYKFRCQEITQKKAHNIQNTAKV